MNADFGSVSAIEDQDLVRLRHVARESHAARAEDAAFLIELDQRSEVEGFLAAGFLAQRIAAVVAGIRHVVVLKPAFAGLIAHRAVDRMMQQQKLHGISDGLLNPRRVGAHDHAIGNRRRAGRHNFGAPFTSTRHIRQLPSMPMSG